MSVGSLAPYTLLWPLSGVIVIALASTFIVAAFDVAVCVPPHVFVKTARDRLPLWRRRLRDRHGGARLAGQVRPVRAAVRADLPLDGRCRVTGAGCGEGRVRAVRDRLLEGCVATDAAVQATPTRRLPLPSEKSPVAFGFVALTVKGSSLRLPPTSS